MRTFTYILFFLVLIDMHAQSRRFKAFLDTALIENNSYITDQSANQFMSSGIANLEMNLLDIDQDLLNATVFHSVNILRKKKHKRELNFSNKLYKSAIAYSRFYRSSKNFNGNIKTRKKVTKSIKYCSYSLNFECGMTTFLTTNTKLLDLKRFGKFHYDRKSVKNGESELGIYKGRKPSAKDSLVVKEEIKPLTYADFGMSIAQNWLKRNARTLKSKALSMGACSVTIDKRTINRNKIPKAKVIFIFGAKRLEKIRRQAPL